jgi:tripartite-type tricarboxylate transporter receptor subunit TctC
MMMVALMSLCVALLCVALLGGLWAPKNMPKDIIAKLNAAVVEAFADPAVRERFAAIGHNRPAP